jgi:hypothetical protein
MSFPLAYIELQVPNSVYEIAERQLDRNCLTSYYKLDTYLWTGTVHQGYNFEVEAKIKQGQVLNMSCDCNDYSSGAPCSHITTLLIQLRRDLTTEKTAPTKPKVSGSTKIKISKLLEDANRDELILFVQQYAKKNKIFANELKVFLSSSMSDLIDTSYYSSLILSAMRINRKKDNSISVKGASHIKTITEELWLQSQDKIASKKYTEAAAILKAMSLQLPIIVDKVVDKTYFSDLFSETIVAFNTFPKKLVSPELALEIFQFLNQELPINTILTNQLGKVYFDALLEMADTQEKKDQLKNTLTDAKSLASNLSKSNYIALILIELRIANAEGNKERSNELIEKHLTQPDILLHLIREAEQDKDWPQVRKFAEIGIQQKFNPNINKTLHRALYQEALISKSSSRIKKYAEQLFLITYELQYLSKLLDNTAKKHIKQTLRALILKLEDLPFHMNKKEAIAEIYLQLDDTASLIAFIQKIKSLELLQNVSERLIPTHKKEITNLYIVLIKDFLAFHLGPVPILKVRRTLLHLRKLGAHSMVHKITDSLALEFSERSALLEELEIL